MNPRSPSRRAALAALLLLGLAAPALAVTVSDADRKMTEEVFRRIVAVAPVPEDFPSWPPVLGFLDEDQFNAYAAFDNIDGKRTPVVRFYAGIYPTGFEGKPDRVAMVVGHELAHHLLGHTRKGRSSDTPLLFIAFTREQELAADRLGMELLLKAGYSFKGAVGNFRRWLDIGMDYSSFEGVGHDHPAPIDRIAALDKEQGKLWSSMGAFSSGAYFLETQQYALAQRAFRQVTNEFPDCYEAWANLGYSILMQYADALDPDDLRKFNLGQIVVGGFYRRPASLAAKVRGINEDQWWEAVGALREAIRLNPNLALPKANLGIAYLIKPGGKDPGKAVQFLEEARSLADKDTSLDPSSRLCLAVNLAVAYSADGKSAEFAALLAAAEKAAAELARESGGSSSLASSALTYNRALAAAAAPEADARKKAAADFESYLRTTSPAVAWWSLAYERYAALCGELGLPAKSRDGLLARAPNKMRRVASVTIGKVTIALGDKVAEVQQKLGPGTTIPVIPGTNLVRVSYPDRGVDFLATEEVIAIQFVSASAPALPLRAEGLSSASKDVKVGMTTDQLDAALGDLASTYDFRQLADREINYRFYSDIGLAVRVQKGTVVEIALAVIPKTNLAQ